MNTKSGIGLSRRITSRALNGVAKRLGELSFGLVWEVAWIHYSTVIRNNNDRGSKHRHGGALSEHPQTYSDTFCMGHLPRLRYSLSPAAKLCIDSTRGLNLKRLISAVILGATYNSVLFESCKIGHKYHWISPYRVRRTPLPYHPGISPLIAPSIHTH